MPYSFWIFLVVCIASFVVAIDDHKAEWEEFKELGGPKKCWKGLKIFFLWFVCVFSFVGTLVLGWESIQDQKESDARNRQYNAVANRLDHVEAEYNQATNALNKATNALEHLASNVQNDESWHITLDQKDRFLDFRGNLYSELSSCELMVLWNKKSVTASQFGPDLVNLLKDACPVGTHLNIVVPILYKGPALIAENAYAIGVTIIVNSNNPKLGDGLCHLLQKAQVTDAHILINDMDVDPNMIVVVVGRKSE